VKNLEAQARDATQQRPEGSEQTGSLQSLQRTTTTNGPACLEGPTESEWIHSGETDNSHSSFEPGHDPTWTNMPVPGPSESNGDPHLNLDPFEIYDQGLIGLSVSMDRHSGPSWDTPIFLTSLPSTPVPSTTHSTSSENSTGNDTTWTFPAAAAESTLSSSTSTLFSASAPPQSPSFAPHQRLQPQHHFLAHDLSDPFLGTDEAHLKVHELNLLRGVMLIAQRLNIPNAWSLASVSPFCTPVSTGDKSLSHDKWSHLPSNLRPTLSQLTQPHHPLIGKTFSCTLFVIFQTSQAISLFRPKAGGICFRSSVFDRSRLSSLTSRSY